MPFFCSSIWNGAATLSTHIVQHQWTMAVITSDRCRSLSILAVNCIEHVNWVPHFAFAREHFDACLVGGLLGSKACDDGNKIIKLLMQAWENRNIAFYSHLCASPSPLLVVWVCIILFQTKRTDNGNEFQPTSQLEHLQWIMTQNVTIYRLVSKKLAIVFLFSLTKFTTFFLW